MDQRQFNDNASAISQHTNVGYNYNINSHTLGRYSSSALPRIHMQGYTNKLHNKLDENKAFDSLSISFTDDFHRNNNENTNLAIIENENDDTELDNDFLNPEDFESMVGDLRRFFVGWLKKTESSLRDNRQNLKQKSKEFQEYKGKVLKQIQIEKQFESDKIKEEKRKLEAETSLSMKQIQVEREDALKKLNENKQKFESEKESHKRKFTIEKQKFLQEVEIFNKDRSRILDNNIYSQAMIDINVGGVIFETSRQTLTRQPNSFLAEILSGRTQITRDKNGCIFFDKDSEIFRIILNFLRNPEFPPIPRDAEESTALVRDAEFFKIKFFQYPLVFACGGHSGVEYLRAVEVFEINEQIWRPCKPMITERAFLGGATLRSSLYVFGGQNLDYKALCDVEVYDCLRDVWINGPPLNIPRRSTTGVAFDERIFSIGGFNGLDIISSVEALDPRMKNWMKVPPMNTPRSSAMATIYDKNIIVMGGTKENNLRSIEIYDSRANKWDDYSSNLIEARSSGAATSLHSNFVFAMGGTDNSQNILDSCEILNKDKTWSFVKNMPEPRMDFSAISISDSIMVSGGQNIEILQSTDFFRPDENEWQTGPPMLFPRYGHALLVASI